VTARVSRHVALLRGYTPGEQPNDSAIIKLNTNENPYPPSPRVCAALRAAADEDLQRYPAPSADALRHVAAQRYAVSPAQVLAGNGSDELLALCMRACVVAGSRVAYVTPTYSLYRTLAAIAAAEAVEVPAAQDMLSEPSFVLPDGLYGADASVTFVCTPTSPFGLPAAMDEIEALCRRTPGIVVSDEAYVDFGGVSALELLPRHENLLVLRTFSKSFSLAGLRLGLAFGAEDLIAELAKVKDSYNVSRLAIAAGVAALDDFAWMRTNVARVVATRERTLAAVRALGCRASSSAANFFWMECPGEIGRSVYKRLRAAGILTRCFDEDGLRDGVRVTVGTDDEMDAFLAALGGA
jgi:histidinol-phosphate aminotransferase